MKKLLPIIALTLLATSQSSYAQGAYEISGARLTSISADGTWTAGSDENAGTFIIINLNTGEEFAYGTGTDDPNTYSIGLGKSVSNNGIVIASGFGTDLGYYWENGDWNLLPIKDTDYACYPNAITPDGSRITGSVSKMRISIDADGIINVPVVWNRNAEGGYDMYVEIAHPSTDWSGRKPQYILPNDISDDGRVIAGNIVDYSGYIKQPIVFTESADGNWTYTEPHPELVNPDGTEFPPFPGESPEEPLATDFMTPTNAELYTAAYEEWIWRPVPEKFDFMSDEGYAAYIDALNAYYDDYETNPYPWIDDYMTADELAAYDAAILAYSEVPEPNVKDYMTDAEYDAYEKAHEQWVIDYETWQVAYYEFDNVFWQAAMNPEALTFVMNSAHISGNGRYYIIGAEAAYYDENNPMGYVIVNTPVLFDLEADTYTMLEGGVKDVLATMVFDNGAVIGATPSDNFVRNAAISKSAGEPFVFLSDLVKESDTETYAWMEDYMTHQITNYDYVLDPETGEYEELVTVEDQLLTGTPVATSDLKTFVTWIYNSWDFSGEEYYSYVLPISLGLDGIANCLSGTDCTVSLDRDGMLHINGDISKVAIYDVNGRMVYNVKAPAATVKTGLQKGIYIVKATSAEGKTQVRKATI